MLPPTTGAHVIKYPSGLYGFVGRVPLALAMEYDDQRDAENARIAGMTIARAIAEKNGRTLRTRTWTTEAEALAALAEHERFTAHTANKTAAYARGWIDHAAGIPRDANPYQEPGVPALDFAAAYDWTSGHDDRAHITA